MYKYQGFTLPMWSWIGASSATESLQQLKSTGTNAVIIDFHLSTDGMTGSVVDYRNNDKTLSQLNEALSTAKSQGLDVWFKPLVLAGYGPDQNSWQDLAPVDAAKWFSTYKTKLLEIARVLEDNRVSHFVLTNELLSLTTNPKNIGYWQDIISSVRQVFHGQIGFNCGALLGPWANGNEVLSVPQAILDSLDFIGLSSYPRVQQSNDFTVQSVTAGWFNSAYQQNLLKTLSDFISTQTKPVYFTELGSPAYQGGNYTYGANFTADLAGQANFYAATLEVLSKYFPTEIQGVFIYNWLLSNHPSGLTNSGSYSPYDWNVNAKPAQQAIASEFSKQTPTGYSKIYALPFSESIKGAESIDTVVFDKAHGQTKITRSSKSIEVNYLDANINYSLSGIERLQFSDKTVAFDIDGTAGQAYRIYQAAFNRTPDNGGLKYWIGVMDSGVPLTTVSAGFIGSAEFQKLYGASPTNELFVTKLYDNVLHRAPDTGGYNYWVGLLNSGGIDKFSTLVNFSESNENQAGVIGVIQNGIDLLN